MKEANEVKGRFKFYDEELEVMFPTDYSTFRNQLSEMLSLSNDSLNNFIIFYKDDKKNKIEIKTQEDFYNFITYIQSKIELITLEVESREANINIKNSLNSILSFKERKNSENNINNNNNIINDNNNIINNKNNIIYNNNLVGDNRQQRNNDNNINNNRNINNRQQPNNNDINNNMNNSQNLAFPVLCYFCGRDTLYKIMYYCKECKISFCMQCEIKYGHTHPHSYYKVQNTSQYEYLNIGVQSQLEKMMDDVGNKMGQAYNSVLSYFGGNSNNNQNQNNGNRNNINNINDINNINNINNVNNINNINDINNINNINNANSSQSSRQQHLHLIEMARSQYDLSNISDKQILDALKQSNNDIDAAVILLISQN
jgi:hypothetical protein